MIMLFHPVFPATPFFFMYLIGLVVAPCLAAIAVYRFFTQQINQTTVRRSIVLIAVLTLICNLIYGCFLFVSSYSLDPTVSFFCLSIPFGSVLAVTGILYTNNSTVSILLGFMLNILAMIGLVSMFKQKAATGRKARRR
jgi:heme/copper-type cytochrome/quinol oxidase subunit 4